MTEETTEVTTTEQAAEPVNITVADLQGLVNLIDVASSRGAFRGAELAAVGTLYTKIATFLQQILGSQEANVATNETETKTETETE
jgi:hypothetical protein